MSVGRISLALVFVLGIAATSCADTVRVIVERALVWTRPSGVSVVMTQLLKDQVVEVVRRTGEWYEIVLPTGSVGTPVRTGFISASQVAVESVGPSTTRVPPSGSRAPAATGAARLLRSVLAVNAVYRAGGDKVTRSAPAFSAAFAEAGAIAADYGQRTGFAFDASYLRHIAGPIGIGASGEFYVRKQAAHIEAHVPHPFFFNQLRTATFDTQPLSAQEIALHIPVAWMPPPMGSINVLVFGGPSIFHVSQDVVTDLSLDSQYPYDLVTIKGVTTENRTSTLFGYHVGGDITYSLTRSTGIGGGVRYTHAKLKFDNDQDATLEGAAGAVEAVVGVRFRF